MNCLVISCSPRLGGNSDTLAGAMAKGVLAAGGETDRVDAARLRIKPCSQCDLCDRQGACVLDDDMADLYPKLTGCDALIFAAPIYFMAHNAQAKLVIDRCQAYWMAKYRLKQPLIASGRIRRGVFIATGATHGPNVFAGAKVTMKWLFDALDMDYWDDMLVEGVDEMGAMLKHPDEIEKAYQMGIKLAGSFKE